MRRLIRPPKKVLSSAQPASPPAPGLLSTSIKISALPGAAALSGPEIIPAVQSGGDVGVTASQLQAFGQTGLMPYVPEPISGNWFQPLYGVNLAAGGAMANNTTLALMPFWVTQPVTIKALGGRLTTAGSNAGANIAFAIYGSAAVAGKGLWPSGAPLIASGSILATTAGIVASAALTPVTLQPGQIYWAAVWWDSLAATATAAVFQTTNVANTYQGALIGSATHGNIAVSNAVGALFLTYTVAAWVNPAAPSWPTITGSSCAEATAASAANNTTALVHLQVN